jgi:hypothetical protein
MVAANPSPSDALAAALRRAQRLGVAVDSKGEARKPSDRTTLFDWHSFQAPEQLHSRSPTGLAVGFGSRATLEALYGFFHP